MNQRCEESDLGVEGEYLKPHGASHYLGDKLYRTNPTDANRWRRYWDKQFNGWVPSSSREFGDYS
jgi:hypothetical protein